MSELTLYDVFRYTLHGLCDIGEKPCFLAVIEQIELLFIVVSKKNNRYVQTKA
jgi:hypothetical protein